MTLTRMNRRNFLHVSGAAVGVSALGCGHASKPTIARESAPSAPPDVATSLRVFKMPAVTIQGSVSGRSFAHVAGVRASGRADQVSATTIFSAASLTKPVFAMAARRLVRSGKLDWHRPLQDYLSVTAWRVRSHGR
jgi:CubicO group peptidase (beta-lactamase class C family)